MLIMSLLDVGLFNLVLTRLGRVQFLAGCYQYRKEEAWLLFSRALWLVAAVASAGGSKAQPQTVRSCQILFVWMCYHQCW